MAEQIEATTLIAAVAGFLAELESELHGRRAFHAKVAQNALAIVARELAQAPRAAERAALAGLLGGDDDLDGLRARACAGLRAGTLGVDTPGLVDALLAAALAKCAVDNPRYATFTRLAPPASRAAD
jgi:hypothetical protein